MYYLKDASSFIPLLERGQLPRRLICKHPDTGWGRPPETRKGFSLLHQVTPYVCTNMDMISQNDNRLLLILSGCKIQVSDYRLIPVLSQGSQLAYKESSK